MFPRIIEKIRGMAWAPDGRSLIVSALSKGADHLFRVGFPGGKAELLGGVAAALAGGGLSISPGTRRMALAQAESDVDIFRVAGPGWPAGQARPDAETLIASTRDDVSPQYSADGKRIVFESGRTGSQEIWSVGADGRDAVQLTSFGGPPVGTPRWSPDGSKVAFDSRKNGNADIFVVSANGGSATALTAGPANHTIPAWSSDGRFVYYASNESGRSEIWKSPAEGGAAVQVTHEGGWGVQHAAGDPWIYWWWNGSLWRMAEAGGAAEKLIDYPSNSMWAPWRDGLVLADSARVGFYRFGDHRATLLQQLPKPPSPRSRRRPTVAVSPDGKWVLYTATVLDRGDLVLVEGFR